MCKHILTFKPRPTTALGQLLSIRNSILVGAILIQSLSLTTSVIAAPAKPPIQSLNDLKLRLRREVGVARTAYNSKNQVPMFHISGKITSQDNNSVVIWGKATGLMGASPSSAGWMLEEGNILISYRDANNITYDRYSGDHYYLGQRYLRNAFGAQVPCKVFGRAPQYRSASETRFATASQCVAELQAAITQRTLADQDARLKAAPTDRALWHSTGQQTLALRSYFAALGIEAPELSQRAAAAWTRAAILDAKAGKLGQSAELLNTVFEMEEPDVDVFPPPADMRISKRDRELLWGTPQQQIRTGPPGSAEPLGPIASSLFQTRPVLYSDVLQAWSNILPSYLKDATQEKARIVLAMSQRLVENAPEETLVHAVKIDAVLAERLTKVRVPLQPARPYADFEYSPLANLGINAQDATEAKNRFSGALVTTVEPYSAAAACGIRPGDIIRTFRAQAVADANDLESLVAAVPRSGTVIIQIQRGSQLLTVRTFLGSTI